MDKYFLISVLKITFLTKFACEGNGIFHLFVNDLLYPSVIVYIVNKQQNANGVWLSSSYFYLFI